MTVKYTLDVSTSRPWTFFKLLLRMRGSIWKTIGLELIVWLGLYLAVSVIYRNALNDDQKRVFERIVDFADSKLHYIPLDFMLGFFVTSVLNRWNRFFLSIGYIDNIALMVAAYVRGADERTRKLRRNIVRYCVLSQALVFRDISMRVRRRFPELDNVVAAGFMMEHEKKKFEDIQYRYAKYWMPFQWALALCHEARQQHKIASDILLQKVGQEIKEFRTHMAVLCNFDWVPLPIAYPQLIVLAVHIYFAICIIARQHIISDDAPNKTKFDAVFPVMTVLQFIFYMGWLKVAEVILNPFGEDDDDFECNFLLDKNLSIGLTVVDEGYGRTPQVMKDMFWEDKIEPLYSPEAAQMERRMSCMTSGLTGSVADVVIPSTEKEVKMMPLADMPPPRRQSVVANLFARRQTVANVSGIPTFPRSRAMSTAAALSTVPAVFSVEADFQKSKSVDAQIEEEKSENRVLRKLRRFSFLPTREPASDMTRRSSVSPRQFAADFNVPFSNQNRSAIGLQRERSLAESHPLDDLKECDEEEESVTSANQNSTEFESDSLAQQQRDDQTLSPSTNSQMHPADESVAHDVVPKPDKDVFESFEDIQI